MIALMMNAARTSETSVDNYFTRQYIKEDKSELHTRRRENKKSHECVIVARLRFKWFTRDIYVFFLIQQNRWIRVTFSL
jgi:hypothetical protein